MIIREIPDNGNHSADTHTRTHSKVETKKVHRQPASSKKFWGVNVSPEHPVTVTFNNVNRLHLIQAVLGEPSPPDNISKGRSLLSIKYGDNTEVYMCSLRMVQNEMAQLDYHFEGPDDIIFSVEGPRGIHLVGFLYDDPLPTCVDTPPIIVNGGGISSRKENSSSRFLHEDDVQEKGRSYKPSPHDVASFHFHSSLTNMPNLSQLHGIVDISGGSVQKEGGIVDILLRTVTQASFQQAASIKELSKTDQAVVLEAEQGEKMGNRKRKNKDPITLLNADSVDGDNDEGLSKLGSSLPDFGKVGRPKRQKKQLAEDQDDIRSPLPDSGKVERPGSTKKPITEDHDNSSLSNPGSPLPDSGKVKKAKRQKKQIVEDHDDIRSSKPEFPLPASENIERPKKRKKQIVEDDDIRSEKHESLQTPVLDTNEAKKLKKRKKKSKKQRAEDGENNTVSDNEKVEKPKKLKEKVVEDDSISATSDSENVEKSKKLKEKVVEDNSISAASDSENVEKPKKLKEKVVENNSISAASDSVKDEKPKKLKEKVVEDDSIRYEQYAKPKAKKPEKSGNKTVQDCEVSEKPDVEPLKLEQMSGSKPSVSVVCALAAFTKR